MKKITAQEINKEINDLQIRLNETKDLEEFKFVFEKIDHFKELKKEIEMTGKDYIWVLA